MRIYMRELLAAFPKLRRSGPFIYLRPVKEMFVGYLVEFPPGGPRLRALRFPLYVRSDIIHLDYSPELAKFRPDGTPPDYSRWASPESRAQPLTKDELQAMWPRKMSSEAEHAFAGRLIARVQQDAVQLDERQDMGRFAEELRPRAQQEPNWQKTLALTLVMLGELDEAHRLVTELMRQADVGFSESGKSDLEETLRSLEAGAAAAQNYRLDVIRQMRSKFSISD
jgi:hypothetical protein